MVVLRMFLLLFRYVIFVGILDRDNDQMTFCEKLMQKTMKFQRGYEGFMATAHQ